MVIDAARKTFHFEVADGKFRLYSYNADPLAENDVTSFDYDFDGRFDFRSIPHGRSELNVDGQWHQLVPEGNFKGYVIIRGTRVPAESVDGMWRIVSEK